MQDFAGKAPRDRYMQPSSISIVYVFAGGGLGAVARYLTTVAAARFISPDLPFGTLIVNVLGCFLIGFVQTCAALGARVSPDARLFLSTGVLGGFTTYSAFNHETLTLVEQGQPARAGLYVLSTLLSCAAAGALGNWAARAITSV